MWGELQELGAGLIGALLLIWALAMFTGLGRPRGGQDGATENYTAPGQDQHVPLDTAGPRRPAPSRAARVPDGPPSIALLFVAPEAGAPMEMVAWIEVIARRGLRGDRYCEGRGFWSEKDDCEVTMIAQEDLDDIEAETGIGFAQGIHRRNIVTRHIALENLAGKRFQIGSAKFAFERPRPPCLHLQTISQAGLVKALVGRSGICIRCFQGGTIRQGDRIVILDLSFATLVKNLARSFWRQAG